MNTWGVVIIALGCAVFWYATKQSWGINLNPLSALPNPANLVPTSVRKTADNLAQSAQVAANGAAIGAHALYLVLP